MATLYVEFAPWLNVSWFVKLPSLICLYKQEALWTGLLPQIRMISQWCEGIVRMVIGN